MAGRRARARRRTSARSSSATTSATGRQKKLHFAGKVGSGFNAADAEGAARAAGGAGDRRLAVRPAAAQGLQGPLGRRAEVRRLGQARDRDPRGARRLDARRDRPPGRVQGLRRGRQAADGGRPRAPRRDDGDGRGGRGRRCRTRTTASRATLDACRRLRGRRRRVASKPAECGDVRQQVVGKGSPSTASPAKVPASPRAAKAAAPSKHEFAWEATADELAALDGDDQGRRLGGRRLRAEADEPRQGHLPAARRSAGHEARPDPLLRADRADDAAAPRRSARSTSSASRTARTRPASGRRTSPARRPRGCGAGRRSASRSGRRTIT